MIQEVYEKKDVTEDAKCIVNSVDTILRTSRNKNFTLIHFLEVFKGKLASK